MVEVDFTILYLMPTDMPTPDVGVVISGLDLPPVCDDCLSHDGLCLAHGKSVLPQLAQPRWYRLVGSVLTPDKALPDESPSVLRAKRRVARRLSRAMRGEFTKSPPAVRAA